jgi:hypothetical protein
MTFTQVLTRQGVRYLGRYPEIALCCPFCAETRHEADTAYCLHVNAGSGAGKCWHRSCGWKSRHAVAAVLHKLRINLSVEGFEEKREAPAAVRLPEDFAPLCKATDDLDKQALRYVLRRGITKEQVKDSKLGVSFSGRYAYRVIFPALAEGKLKAFTARDFTGTSKARYLGTPGDKWLFHFDPKADTVVLSEGVFKALRIAQATSWGSAALLGHAISPVQMEQIKSSSAKRVVLYPDPDAVGRTGFISVAEKLITEWGGEVLLSETVENPADEDPLETLAKNLQNIAPYSWTLKQRMLSTTGK